MTLSIILIIIFLISNIVITNSMIVKALNNVLVNILNNNYYDISCDVNELDNIIVDELKYNSFINYIPIIGIINSYLSLRKSKNYEVVDSLLNRGIIKYSCNPIKEKDFKLHLIAQEYNRNEVKDKNSGIILHTYSFLDCSISSTYDNGRLVGSSINAEGLYGLYDIDIILGKLSYINNLFSTRGFDICRFTDDSNFPLSTYDIKLCDIVNILDDVLDIDEYIEMNESFLRRLTK